MSDCSNGGRKVYDVPFKLPDGSVMFIGANDKPAFVSVVFEDDRELTRDFPFMLGHRKISHVKIDGVKYVPQEVAESDAKKIPYDELASREIEVTRLALRMVRDFFAKNEDEFENDCIELERYFYDIGNYGLAEYVSAQMYPDTAFVPM